MRLDQPINLDEDGIIVFDDVWTSTSVFGVGSDRSCVDWTEVNDPGPLEDDAGFGRTDTILNGWTSAGIDKCFNFKRIYCFEQ